MSEQKVGPGMYVEYSYKLYDDADGSVLFETPAKQPDRMVYGVSHEVVPGLIATLDGLKAGDKFGVTLPPAVAFGDRNEEDVMELPRDIFMRDGELAEEVVEGAVLPMMTAEGYRIVGTVLEVGDKVKMDFNHPFAGKKVRYDGEVVTVREATPEELQPVSGGCCGGGCSGGNCQCGGEQQTGSCNCNGGC